MVELLLITDDLPRGERLARDIGTFRPCRLHDLYGDAPTGGKPAYIISDINVLTSDAIQRLRHVLGLVRREGVPFLFLVHGNAARAEIQARVLGADGTLAAGSMSRTLIAALEGLHRQHDPIGPLAERHAGAARRFLADVFRPSEPVRPTVIDAGTRLIARAVRDVGVREWVCAVRQFDDMTHQHCLLVAGFAAAFANSLGLSPADSHQLTKAAVLHDIGKIRVPIEILNKPGRLTDAERQEMEKHPLYGYAMLSGCGFEPEVLMVVRSHHEMLDGSGYPDGLKGSEIPDLVRLVAICDIYAALIERRSYKPAISMAKALAILDGMHGRLDVALLNAFRPVAAAFGTIPPELPPLDENRKA